ncbi:unnamed protein product [marine sediment metagenome]|uniref:Uncharacterized protein n=1 Tax=marine sediment metagenome TaxID=412755 RepID=X1FTR1_9ZZZZ
MAHIIVAAEGWSEHLEKFEKAFNGREYCDGECKLRVREIKLYNLGFNECGYKEVLADLKGMMRYNQDKRKTQKDTSHELHSKFQKYIRYFRKFFKMIKPIEDDLDSVEVSSFVKDNQKKGNWFMTSLIPIGLVNDYHDENGKEFV